MDMPFKFALYFVLIVAAMTALIYLVALFWPDPKPVAVATACRSDRHVRPKPNTVRSRRSVSRPVHHVHVRGYVSFDTGRVQKPHQ